MNRIVISLVMVGFSTPAFAGGGSAVGQAINLILLFAVLAFLTRKPIGKMLSSRSQAIEAELEASQAELVSAQAKLEEVNAKLANMGSKIADMEEKAKNEIEAMQKDILANAERDANRIKESAKRSIDEELARAKMALQKEAVLAAVELAAETIRKNITDSDNKRLSDDLIAAARGQNGH